MQSEYQVEFEHAGYSVTATGNGYDECLVWIYDAKGNEVSADVAPHTYAQIEHLAVEALQDKYMGHADVVFERLKGN